MKITVKPFEDLTLSEFHDLVQLRIEVFILEQQCLYQELDGDDPKARHVLVYDDQGNLAAYARLFARGIKGEEASIGRVITSPRHRSQGYGDVLMGESIRVLSSLGEMPIRISAQRYAQGFYARHGFVPTAKAPYLEDNIPHLEMILQEEVK